jgi:hypothetical protein
LGEYVEAWGACEEWVAELSKTLAKEIARLAGQAQEALREGSHDQALSLVEEYLALPGSDQTWGKGILQSVLERLLQQTTDAAAATKLTKRLAALREEIVGDADLEEKPWLHAWQVARELNNRAWSACEKGGNAKQRGAVLRDVEKSLEFWPYFFSHLDTRLRILARLGRLSEAFPWVRWVEAIQPGWRDFDDIRGSREYRAWLKAHAADPIVLPSGPATLGEVAPRLASSRLSDPAGPLNEHERATLRQVRLGRDEWHRARSAALLSCLLDLETLAPRELLTLPPQSFDLTRGVLAIESGERRLEEDLTRKLRHWLLVSCNNHPAFPGREVPKIVRERMFYGWDFKPLKIGDVEALLKEVGAKTAMRGLGLGRFPRPPEGRRSAQGRRPGKRRSSGA